MPKPVPRKPAINVGASKPGKTSASRPSRQGARKSGESKAQSAKGEGSKKKRRRGANREWSIKTVAILLAAFIAFLGWSFASAHYAKEAEGWRAIDPESQQRPDYSSNRQRVAIGWLTHLQGLLAFFWNGIVQLRNLPFVIWHVLRNAIWLPLIFLFLEGGVVLFVFYDRKLRREWEGMSREPHRLD